MICRHWATFAIGLLLSGLLIGGAPAMSATEDWREVGAALDTDTTAVVRQATESLRESETRGDKEGRLKALRMLGMAHVRLREFARLQGDVERGIPLAQELGNIEALCEFLSYRAILTEANGSPAQAIAQMDEAIALANQHQLKRAAAMLYFRKGGIHDTMGRNADALASFHQAYPLFEEQRDSRYMSATLNSLGNVYSKEPATDGDLDRAADYYERALQVGNPQTDRSTRSESLYGLAIVHHRRRDFARARQYYESSFAIARQIGTFEALGEEWVLARLAKDEQKFDEALIRLDRALAIYRRKNDLPSTFKVELDRAEVLARLGQRQASLQALASLRAALPKFDSRAFDVEYHARAAAIHTLFGDYPEALRQMNELREADRRFQEAANARLADELRVRFGVQLKETENALLRVQQQEAEAKRLALNLALALSVLLLAGTMFVLRKRAASARAEALHHKELAASDARQVELLQTANAMLKQVATFGQDIAAKLDPETIFRTVCDDLGGLLDVASASAWMIEEDSLALRFCLPTNEPLPALEVPLDSADSHIARCARERRELIVHGAADPQVPAPAPGAAPTLATLCAPLIAGGGLLGVLVLQSARENAYGEREQQLVRTLAAYGAVALANAANARRLTAASQAKSWFLANMSHELRTPLNAILGYAQLLQLDKSHLSDKEAAGLGTIQKSGEHLLTLIDDILDVARIESGKLQLNPAPVSLAPFLSLVADVVRMGAERKGVRFVQEVAADLPQAVLADEKRLRQILLNLLGNAVKFTDLGEVVLRVERIPNGETEARLRFEVRDTGIGIARSQLETIFQPFEQVGEQLRRASGTGLGLTISRQLVLLMGGRSGICVESNLGQGSRFWFELTLPIPAPQRVSEQHERVVTGYEGQRRKVLIVDDVRENRALLADMLGWLDFKVLEAEDGARGVELAEATRPDLILIDSVMPGMGGLEATQQLRASKVHSAVPIIVVSAAVSTQDREQSLAGGADAFLPKPIDFKMLQHEMRRLLELTWIYAKEDGDGDAAASSAALVAPPSDQMQALHHLALTGNMREIREYAAQLAALDARYRPFADTLDRMARGFQSSAIRRFVEQHLQGGTGGNADAG